MNEQDGDGEGTHFHNAQPYVFADHSSAAIHLRFGREAFINS